MGRTPGRSCWSCLVALVTGMLGAALWATEAFSLAVRTLVTLASVISVGASLIWWLRGARLRIDGCA